MSIPKWPKRHYNFGCINKAFVNDVNDTSFCEKNGKFEIIDSEAIIKKDDTVLHYIEADRGENSKFLGWTRRSDRD